MNSRSRTTTLYVIIVFSLGLLLLVVADRGLAEPIDRTIETKVLRVFATKKAPYYHKPWKSPDFTNLKASGFFFRDDNLFPGKKGLILTNAHAVSMAESIKVSNGREKRQYDVGVVGICNSADFAVLEMAPADLEVYESQNGRIEPLELGDSDTLRVGDKVQGWGYPLGGERISKSEQGEISRIEVKRYAYSHELWLMVQASLQQNQGNSGGPVLKDGKVVGIAFQGVRTGDRINYFIPINVVKHLSPVLDNQALIPTWRYAIQFMFPRLKEYFHMGPDQGGVLLNYIIPDGGPYSFGLRSRDILTEIDGFRIDNYGEIYFKPLAQRLYFSEILNRKRVGDPLTIKVIRDGKTMDISGKVTPGLPRLVPQIFTMANYFVFGGVGFVELTMNCIENLGQSGDTFRARYAEAFPDRPYEKIVTVSEIFPDYGLVDSSGYLNRVTKIGDVDVVNIQQLSDTIQNLVAKGEKRVLLKIYPNMTLPLDLSNAAELDNQIKEKYGILYLKTPGGFHN
ncbi:MAG: trypsin-like peptidase domain-containing protein [Deltaproteobacteria bacterium]|nr:trypsin-like peptidase domain-containing protein [Deltaproteobacteria bacterium]